ncbi:DNA-binding protein [Janthinobacterium tructae]|uniref:DNA-binding protein n=1 Tax=Janthinobacterium tructae TaxID=2590869 RepID=UPI00249BD7FF|nr:DNA-binding protein [Janthinobacterium tructae]MDI3292299.1 DNA-binding protein [Janthinobacterium tructae]
MLVSNDIQERIFAAADSLYEQSGYAALPTVDAVRKSARVNMNDASTGMRLWRQAHTVGSAASLSDLPDSLRQAHAIALGVLWRDARHAAAEQWRIERTHSEAERAHAEAEHQQLINAFDTQATQLAVVEQEVAKLHAECAALHAERQEVEARWHGTVSELALARAQAERNAVRAEEAQRLSAELRKELDHAHREFTRVVQESDRVREKGAAELATANHASSAALERLGQERDGAIQRALESREAVAVLRAQFNAATAQNASLLQLFSAADQQ